MDTSNGREKVNRQLFYSFRCCQIEITRAYDHSSFFEDLRKMYFNAGANNENTVFLFTDTQIVQEDFLEDINNMLNSGKVGTLTSIFDFLGICRGSS